MKVANQITYNNTAKNNFYSDFIENNKQNIQQNFAFGQNKSFQPKTQSSNKNLVVAIGVILSVATTILSGCLFGSNKQDASSTTKNTKISDTSTPEKKDKPTKAAPVIPDQEMSPQVWYNACIQFQQEFFANKQMIQKAYTDPSRGIVSQYYDYSDKDKEDFQKFMNKEHSELTKYNDNPKYITYSQQRDRDRMNESLRQLEAKTREIDAQGAINDQRRVRESQQQTKQLQDEQRRLQKRIDAGEFTPKYSP